VINHNTNCNITLRDKDDIIFAGQESKSVSRLARDILDRALAKAEKAKLSRVYDVFRELDGIEGRGIDEASTMIDEVLYGEKGAWRGTIPDEK
jgi:hypothetical protein